MHVDLALVGPGSHPSWRLGAQRGVAATPRAIGELFDDVVRGAADAVLLWDPSLGTADPDVVEDLLSGPSDVYHAGLCLGQAGRPTAMRFVEPIWMHACDAPAERESTSWRVSFRACLIRRSVLEQMRRPCTAFRSLDAAALELGMHWLRRGVFVRHTPALVGNRAPEPAARLDAHDELLFVRRSFAPSWVMWAAARGTLTGAWSALDSTRSLASALGAPRPERETFRRPAMPASRLGTERVSVLVPTIERYPYLRVLLGQLRTQTVPAHEIIVVDQTPAADRDPSIAKEFADLPLKWITLETAGQCTSRNAGLRASTGDHVLFVDDDDEVEPTLIQLHLEALQRFGGEVSCGVANELGIPELPEAFTFTRASDVFPTNNTMVRRALLERTALFDLAYDRQQRADADLGMRAHLSGAFMVLNPEIQVLHHHAPRGGLRTHGARAITYASSRRALLHRQLPSASEIYLATRYLGEAHANELIWQRALGTISGHGGPAQRIAKAAVGAVRLSDTVRAMQRVHEQARSLLREPPRIPELLDRD